MKEGTQRNKKIEFIFCLHQFPFESFELWSEVEEMRCSKKMIESKNWWIYIVFQTRKFLYSVETNWTEDGLGDSNDAIEERGIITKK